MKLIITRQGERRGVYDESIPLRQLGRLSISRGSYVEPDTEGNWWAELSPVDGPKLGPVLHRSSALAAEVEWLMANWLDDEGLAEFAEHHVLRLQVTVNNTPAVRVGHRVADISGHIDLPRVRATPDCS